MVRFFLCDGSRHGCCLRRASFFALRRDNGASLLAGMSRRILYHRCIACAWPSQLVQRTECPARRYTSAHWPARIHLQQSVARIESLADQRRWGWLRDLVRYDEPGRSFGSCRCSGRGLGACTGCRTHLYHRHDDADTFNGLIMGQVLVNPSNGSVKARRIISIIISLLSLGGAAYQLANWLAPSAFKLSNTTELGMSILLVMATFACYMTLHLSRRARQ